MDLSKTGRLLLGLRKETGLTQRKVAETIGVCSKTVSKWETGRGFPDVGFLSALATLYKVDAETLLAGEMPAVRQEVGNVKKTKFYVCEKCGNITMDAGRAEITCCGRKLLPLTAKEPDAEHMLRVEMIEDENYISFSHPMAKEHYIAFVAYVRFDRVLTVRLYPEQGGELRFPRFRGGMMYYYCTEHGLFAMKG